MGCTVSNARAPPLNAGGWACEARTTKGLGHPKNSFRSAFSASTRGRECGDGSREPESRVMTTPHSQEVDDGLESDDEATGFTGDGVAAEALSSLSLSLSLSTGPALPCISEVGSPMAGSVITPDAAAAAMARAPLVPAPAPMPLRTAISANLSLASALGRKVSTSSVSSRSSRSHLSGTSLAPRPSADSLLPRAGTDDELDDASVFTAGTSYVDVLGGIDEDEVVAVVFDGEDSDSTGTGARTSDSMNGMWAPAARHNASAVSLEPVVVVSRPKPRATAKHGLTPRNLESRPPSMDDIKAFLAVDAIAVHTVAPDAPAPASMRRAAGKQPMARQRVSSVGSDCDARAALRCGGSSRSAAPVAVGGYHARRARYQQRSASCGVAAADRANTSATTGYFLGSSSRAVKQRQVSTRTEFSSGSAPPSRSAHLSAHGCATGSDDLRKWAKGHRARRAVVARRLPRTYPVAGVL